ncbi:glycosyltransferase family 2 protein [Bacteroidota bacterium]
MSLNTGGYRTKNISSSKEDGKPVVSIITVVYNSEKLIEKTINNIISQTYKNIEYIIIDGASKDKTLDIIRKYEKQIAYWISEPDNGLYDAMNKGLNSATGDYVWFINSGDLIFDKDTLKNVFENEKSFADIYYGETMNVDDNYKKIGLRRLKAPENLTWKSFRNGMMVCHQSIIINRKITDNYDLQYKRSADYDWVLKALRKTDKIKNTKQILSRYMEGGVSRKTIPGSLKERFNIMTGNYGLLPTILTHVLISIKFFWYWARKGRF